METLSKRYHADLPKPSEDFQFDRAAIFAGVENKPEDPANLFRIAIAFEQRAVDFFSAEGERAPEGSVERDLYRELAAEEREHVELLTTEYRRWQSGKAGIL
jgi:rubrerythrin